MFSLPLLEYDHGTAESSETSHRHLSFQKVLNLCYTTKQMSYSILHAGKVSFTFIRNNASDIKAELYIRASIIDILHRGY